MIRKSFSGITKVVDEAQGLVEAIVNSTGIEDLQRDVMEPGCWDDLCKSMSVGDVNYPSILWGHDWAIPVGKVLHAEELYPGDARLKALKAKKTAGGLRIVGQYNLETQRGREAYSDVKHGVIKQWSVGFMPTDDGHAYDAKGVHHIAKVGVWPEVSNVLVGASPGTYTAVAKSAEEVMTNNALTLDEKADEIERLLFKDLDDLPEDGENERLGEILGVVKSAIHDWLTAGAEPIEKEAEPIQQQAATTADASPTAEQLAEKLTQLVIARLNAPPQHSDLEEDSGELTITQWAKQNIRPTQIPS